MADGYQGQPEYVVNGYFVDLLEPWVQACDSDEWGDFMARIHEAAQAGLSCSDDERAAVLVGWLREELQRAWDEDWWGVKHDWNDWVSVYNAQDEFERITDYWRDRARSFKGEAALETVVAGLPEWIKPMPDRLPKLDPDRVIYERLKAKFERQDDTDAERSGL